MRKDWQRCGICGSKELWRSSEVPDWCEACGSFYHQPSARWISPKSSSAGTAKTPVQMDHAALQQAKVKEILVYLRDPNTYVVRPGNPIGVWMDDGMKIAAVIQERFLAEAAELSLSERIEHVRRAGRAVDLTTIAFTPSEAHYWNASEDTVLFEGIENGAVMPSGQRVDHCFTFVIGFGIKTDA